MKIPIISLFTGGGLFDIGFETVGYRVFWTNEVYPAFADMYEHGVSAWRKADTRTKGDVHISCRKSITEISAQGIVEQAFGSNLPEVFGVIGGPPCPDFSVGGLNGGGLGKTGRLSKEFVRKVAQIQPTFFVMENVPGLIRTSKHFEYFKSLFDPIQKRHGYLMDYRVLNALEYGVAQSRERVFVFGVRRACLDQDYLRSLGKRQQGWFTWPEAPYKGACELPWPRIDKYGETPSLPDGIPLELTISPLVGEKDDPEGLPNGLDFFNPHSKKFWERNEGDVYAKSFKRLHRYRYSPTAWYGNNEVHLHPWKPRRISVREALRIQSVPDSYILPDDIALSLKFKLVCNGVPCRLSEHLARAVKRFILKHCKC